MDTFPINNPAIEKWINDSIKLLHPDQVYYADGSAQEWEDITTQLVSNGTFIRLNASKKPNSFLANSDPKDVARVESRTFICSLRKEDAGPTNNWMDPEIMRSTMQKLFKNSMVGRTLYVIPFCMGPLDAEDPKIGIELTDSPYVLASMHIMTRVGNTVWKLLENKTDFVKGIHSVGYPLPGNKADIPWPSNETKYISHFPEGREIWSYGSGYGGNALLGKKCFALRIASVLGKDEGWLAEHMLILKLTSPENKIYYIAAAFPSACGKTNLAMLQPTIPGWKAETIGDDIAWLRPGKDGRLYATNPEAGFFGVAPGTNEKSNLNAMETLHKGNTIYTNVALTDDKDVWWEGLSTTKPKHLIDWQQKDWTPTAETKAAHPNSRYCTPIAQSPTVAPEWEDPTGVPISAILFGGRRKDTIPLVVESDSWAQGVFYGATLSSETTAAAEGQVGKIRRDPMAMLPFMGYHIGDYLQHWLQLPLQQANSNFPKIFLVNWFRKNAAGEFLWPGFGENSRVLEWIINRLENKFPGKSTPLGVVPNVEEIDIAGLPDFSAEKLTELLSINPLDWQKELPLIKDYFAFIGEEKLPAPLKKQLAKLTEELATANLAAH